MADQKISQLNTISTVDTAADLFPIVDTSATETKKITPSALKTALALNNVDNTADADKPISSATQTGLDAKQATLVSGTNIKTINSTSLLGSGDIVVGATPSGVAGAIQFSDGTAFSSDATNLFWDDTNNRLGVGTNSPSSPLSIVNTISLGAGATNPRIENIAYTINNSGAQTGTATGIFLNATETALNGQTHNLIDLQKGGVSQFKVDNTGNLTSIGSLTSNDFIQVEQTSPLRFGNARSRIYSNSDGNLRLSNAGQTTFGLLQLGGTTSSFPAIKRNGTAIEFRLADDSGYCRLNVGLITAFSDVQTTGNIGSYGFAYFGSSGTINTSAVLQADSTTKGFLPPRMTTTQKNAIATPASGLVVYDTTLGKLCVRGASAWETITSL